MKFALGIFLLLLGYYKVEFPDKKDTVSQVYKVDYDITRYRSFKHFLDSMCYMDKRSLVKKNLFPGNRKVEIDTLYSKHGLQRIKKKGIVQQYYFLNQGANINDPKGCYSFLGIGGKRFNHDTLMCWQEFDYLSNSLITYNKSSFIIMKGGPYPDNCIGAACRINFYPVIGIDKSDTSLHYFVNTDDITGIRYADINHDGYLDFLSIKSGFTHKDIEALAIRNKKYDNFNCSDAECYKITVFSFKEGKWEAMKDKNGKEYFMLIKLDDSLNPNSDFELLMSNWI